MTREVAFLLVLFGLFMGQLHADTRILCENRRGAVRCPRGQVLRIHSANFGRQTDSICPKLNQEKTQGTCSNDVKDTVVQKCEGQQKCRIAANKKNFDRSLCADILALYLDIEYECRETIHGFTQIGDNGQDCPGEDIEFSVQSVEECAAKCAENIFCGGILVTDSPVHGYTCWLKYKLCDIPVPLNGGRLFRNDDAYAAPQGFVMHSNIGEDCPGKDIAYGLKSWQECATDCDTNIFCRGFLVTAIQYGGNNCFLKYQLCDNPNPLVGGLMFLKAAPVEPPIGFEQHGIIGQDCPGNDITHSHKPWKQCAADCENDANCGGILVTGDILYGGNNCWLKTQLCDNPNPLPGGLMFKRVYMYAR